MCVFQRVCVCVLCLRRDQERALLARAMSLLHSPAAAPEAEVSAKELQQDAVMAQLAQCAWAVGSFTSPKVVGGS